MPNVHPSSGVRHPVEPDKSLRAFRAVDEGAPRSGCLGMQLTPLFDDDAAVSTTGTSDDDGGGDDRTSWVGVGMDVVVEMRGAHVYVKQ